MWEQLLLLYLCWLYVFCFVLFCLCQSREKFLAIKPPIIVRDCQWTFIVTHICCEVQMKQMFCKSTKMISFFFLWPLSYVCNYEDHKGVEREYTLWNVLFLVWTSLTRDEAELQKKMCLSLKYRSAVQHLRVASDHWRPSCNVSCSFTKSPLR